MTDRKAIFVYSEELEKYPYPPEHPFNTTRAPKTRQLIKSLGWLSGPTRKEVSPKPAKRMTLKKFHTNRYLYALKNAAQGKLDIDALRMGIGSSDCPVFKGVYEHSILATGATLTAAERLLAGDADVAFNPHGGFHHAFPEKAAGFCYVNDVALACFVLAEAGKRVLYLDIDVHHGDGVAYAFYERRDVMTISFHENPHVLFPGTGFEDEIGQGEGKGYCVNVPMPVGTYDLVYLNAFEAAAVPLIKAFNPDVFVFELGADTLAQDPLAHLQLTNNAYVDIVNRLLGFNKPILMTGGGGYQVANTVRSWALAWSVLCGADDGGEAHLGMGGVMLGSTDWTGGLRDPELVIPRQQRESVAAAAQATVERIKRLVFPFHGL